MSYEDLCTEAKKEYTEDLLKLSNYYGFKIMTTNPRRGNEKGHVETSGKVIRSNLFTFDYRFYSLDDFQNHVKKEMEVINLDSIQKFNEEKSYLRTLPLHRYELGRIERARVNSESLITLDTNFYSVPDLYIGSTVTLSVYMDKVIIYDDKDKEIARHNKKSGRKEHSINIHHFLATLDKKPGALRNSLALKQAPNLYQELFHNYFTTDSKGFLDLIKTHTIYELTMIVKELEHGKSIQQIQVASAEEPSIEAISSKQISAISQLYNQGEQ